MKTHGEKIAALLLAAGRGERMMPLTASYPKPLLPILGVPLFQVLVQKLVREGASEVHCNLFHLPDTIEKLAEGRGWPIVFHRERELLGTGGGIGNMADAVASADAILLHNGDVLADIGFDRARSFHRERGALATLVLVPEGPRANVAMTERGEVVAIGAGAERPARGLRRLGYTGMAVLSPESLDRFPRGERAGLVDILLGMLRDTPGSVVGWDAASLDSRYAWGDVGAPAGYLDVHRRILVEKTRYDPALEPPPLPLHVGEGAVVEPGARWNGFCEIGRRATVERDAVLTNCVVLEGTTVPRGSVHANKIVFPGGALEAGGA